MKALTYQGKEHVEVKEVEAPRIQDARDAIIRITATGICGSDLHLYKNGIPAAPDYIIGHEPMGIVEETGSEVQALKKGDRVVIGLTLGAANAFIASIKWRASATNQIQTRIPMPAVYLVSLKITAIFPEDRLNTCGCRLLIFHPSKFLPTVSLRMNRSCFYPT